MSGWGTTGHGPSWKRVRTAVQETADSYLKEFSEPFLLCHPSETGVGLEVEVKVKMLEGLHTKVTKEGQRG